MLEAYPQLSITMEAQVRGTVQLVMDGEYPLLMKDSQRLHCYKLLSSRVKRRFFSTKEVALTRYLLILFDSLLFMAGQENIQVHARSKTLPLSSLSTACTSGTLR
jgi:ATP-dependent DNA ligase